MSEVRNLSRDPLDVKSYPVALRKHVDPRAPLPLRDMGAKGLVPGIAPHDLVWVLYQLHFDEDVKDKAKKTFEELPDDFLKAAASQELPVPVLDFCARKWLEKREAMSLLLRNPAIDDQTVAFIAGNGDDHLGEIISENQARLIRAPIIIEQLYLNPRTHQSVIDRVLEFAHRQGVTFTGLPGLQQALEANLIEAKLQEEPTHNQEEEDAVMAQFMMESVVRAEEEDASGLTTDEIEEKIDLFKAILDGDQESETAEQAEEAAAAGSRLSQIQGMKISQKVRLATCGSREDRAILIRDPNRMVHMSALMSPKTQPRDLKAYAGNKNLPDNVINYISNKRDVMRDYSTLRVLINNPKLALRTGVRLLSYLRPNDLRTLSKNRNISPQLAKQAKLLAEKRRGGRG